MLYSISRVSMRPLASTTIRRVLGTSSLRPIQYLASRRAYASTVSKPRAVKAAPKSSKAVKTKKATPAKKTAKKPVKKTAAKPKRKTVAKKKKKPAPKKTKPRGRTEKQKELLAKKKARDKLQTVKETALLSEPAALPQNTWLAFIHEHTSKAGADVANVTKELGPVYKSLSPAEIERLNQTVAQNAHANEIAYKKWVSSFTLDQIRKANNARATLRRLQRAKNGRTKKGIQRYRAIHDERLPKRPLSAFALFTKEKWANGDYKGVTIADAAKLTKVDWAALSAAHKKELQARVDADHLRYAQELKTVTQ